MKDCIRQWMGEQMADFDDTIREQLYQEYVTTAKRLVGEISAIDAAAHTLKGNAMMIGDQPMAEAAIALRAKITEIKQLMEEL